MELQNIVYPIFRSFEEEDGGLNIKISSANEVQVIFIEQIDIKDNKNIVVESTKESYDDLIKDVIEEYGEDLITATGDYKDTEITEKDWDELVGFCKENI